MIDRGRLRHGVVVAITTNVVLDTGGASDGDDGVKGLRIDELGKRVRWHGWKDMY